MVIINYGSNAAIQNQIVGMLEKNERIEDINPNEYGVGSIIATPNYAMMWSLSPEHEWVVM